MRRTDTQTPTLFELDAEPVQTESANPRQKAIDAVLEKQNEVWKAAYESFVLDYLKAHGAATAEEIRLSYEADSMNPKPTHERASGGVFQRLRKQRKIKQVGYKRSKVYGNMLPILTLTKNSGERL